jgi:hypothetical protein
MASYHHTTLDLSSPATLERLTDADIFQIAETPEYLCAMSPLEREMLTRLTALMESTQSEIQRLDSEIDRLSQYEPVSVARARQTKARTDLWTLVAEKDDSSRPSVRVEIALE